MSIFADTATRLARVAPQIRPAGVAGSTANPTARDLTSSYNPDGRVTPDRVKKFHHRGPEVGATQRHWGISADAAADADVRYGAKAKSNAGVDECLRPGVHADKMSTLIGEQRERNYASERQRPLGRNPEPKDPVKVPLCGFGKPNEKGESTAGTFAAMRDVEVRHPVGAQTERGYNWQSAGVDPTQHRFGVPTDRSETAGALLRGDGETMLVPKMVKDYQSTVAYEVGKPRPLCFDEPAGWGKDKPRPASQRPSAANGFQAEQPSVKDLLSSWVEGEPPEGGRGSRRAMLKSRTTLPPEGAHGVAPRATVSTLTGTGKKVEALDPLDDESSASHLLNPCHYVALGVESKYFAAGRDLEDVRQLAAKCGFGLSDAQVDEVFATIAVDGKCGIEQFKNAASAKGYM